MQRRYLTIILLFITFLTQAQIVNIPDPNFKNALIINGVDSNGDNEIQVTEAEVVVILFIADYQISSLEGIQSFTNLEILYCYNNLLTSLDFSLNSKLRQVSCFNNQLTELNVTQNLDLQVLWCYENNLTALDVSQNPNLGQLNCSGNQLTNLDITQNLNLGRLECNDNQITNLDLSQFTDLFWLVCNDNTLTSLNIKNGNNSNIRVMWAFDNPDLLCINVDDESATYPNCDVSGDSGWCKDAIAQYSEECVLGINENITTLITLFPNPTINLLFIDSQEQVSRAKIYDSQGKFIKEVFTTKIDVFELNRGLYFIQIFIGDKVHTDKFLKN